MAALNILTILILLSFIQSTSFSQVYLTKENALGLYLGEEIERKTIFLTDNQVMEIQNMAKTKMDSRIVTYYSNIKGIAFFETRIVRTMPMTFLIVINPKGIVKAVEILAFYEPEDYLPPKRWLKTFEQKTIHDDLWLKRGVYNVSGATLSAYAITESVRKYLAVHTIAILKEQQ